MWETIRVIAALAFIGFLSYMLLLFVRGWISEWRTRGAEDRLRHPNPDGIQEICGFPPPPELIEFYKNAPFIDSGEFELVDNSKVPPVAWFIMGFMPLTALDVREYLWASKIPGIPIAYSLEGGGVYFVAENGAVMLDSRNIPGRRVQVAPSITEFTKFEVRVPSLEDEEDLTLRLRPRPPADGNHLKPGE